MTPQDPHATFRENIEAYLAGGLSASDASDFETHAATCPECAAAFAHSKATDESLRTLFSGVAPAADFEDRLVKGLRVAKPTRRVHPFIRVAAGAVAAAVVLAAVGHFGGQELGRSGQRAFATSSGNRVAKGMILDARFLLAGDVNNATSDFAEPNLTTATDGVTHLSTANRTRELRLQLSDDQAQRKPAATVSGGVFVHGDALLDSDKLVRGEKAKAGLAEVSRQKDEPAQRTAGLGVPPPPALYYFVPTDQPKNAPSATWAMGRNGAVMEPAAKPVTLGSAVNKEAEVREEKQVVTLALGDTDGKTAQRKLPELADKSEVRDAVERPALMVDGQKALSGDAVTFGVLFREPPTTGTAPDAAKPPTTGEAPPATRPTTAEAAAAASRKIIRTGTLEFEVESFDSAFGQVAKIVAEEAGFVATTDSQKLPNGKVQGTVTLRCPPEHLDTLVLKLRGIGDLKTQRITSQDVTKQFTDFESQLRAARAMETRLLEIIKTGKGTVKDLVEAEKQLGVYREKIETIEGELRFMGSQVSLSTLQVSMTERDIRTPFSAVQSEQISAGIEAEDVEKTRAEAMKLIEDAKGRVIESDLKRLDAGQLAATIVAEVGPDAAGPLGDKLKLLGRVARWDAERKQTAQGGSEASGELRAGAKLERQATRFSISLYNLANVAPRERTTLTLVTNDVEAAYRAILAAVKGDDKTPSVGRIVTSNLANDNANQVTGSINLEVKSDQSAALDAALRTSGSVMHLTVTENADQTGVTTAKRGYAIAIVSTASVPPRETQIVAAASKDVAATYAKLLAVLRDPKQGAHVTSSQLIEQEQDNVTGSADFDIPLAGRAAVEAILADGKSSDVITRNVVRSSDTENTLADKLRLTVTISGANGLPPRQSTAMKLEVADVRKMLDTAAGIGGSDTRVLERNLNQQEQGGSNAHLTLDVPLSAASNTLDQLRALGKVSDERSAENLKVTPGPLSRARFEVELTNTETLVAPEEGVGFSIRAGLKKALAGLLWSVQMVVIGLVLVGPFALVAWLIWKLVRRGRKSRVPA